MVNHWPILTADISKAFLQGVTYEELRELTGEPLREPEASQSHRIEMPFVPDKRQP